MHFWRPCRRHLATTLADRRPGAMVFLQTAVGRKVRIEGLSKNTDLNQCVGTVVESLAK